MTADDVLVAKCLIKVDETTILDHQLEALSIAGINEVTIVVGYEKEQIFAHARSKPVSIKPKDPFHRESGIRKHEQHLFASGCNGLAARRQFYRPQC